MRQRRTREERKIGRHIRKRDLAIELDWKTHKEKRSGNRIKI